MNENELPPDVNESDVFGAIVLGCRQSHQQSIDSARRVLMGVAHACPGSMLADALEAIKHHLGGEHLAGGVVEMPCKGCNGRGGWEDGDEGQWVTCMECNNNPTGPCTYCGAADHWRPDCPKIAAEFGTARNQIGLGG